MQSAYYQPSGRISSKLLIYTIALAAVAIPFAWGYAWLTYYIPFIYLNLFIAIGFAIVLSFLALTLASLGKARNPLVMTLLGFAVGVFGWYCQWVAWSGIVSNSISLSAAETNYIPGIVDFALNPELLFSFVKKINEIGIWKIKGATLNGSWLSAAWAIEFIIMTALPSLLGRSEAQKPFCEASGLWAKEVELSKHFAYVADKDKLRQSLESSPVSLLGLLPAHDGMDTAYSQLKMYRCQGSNESFVSIINTTVKIEKDKEKKSTETILQHLRIPKLTADVLALHCSSASS